MIDLLKQLEKELPKLIEQNTWKSLKITYEEPNVYRLWTPVLNNTHRLCIHKIFKCKNQNSQNLQNSRKFKSLYHPHDWPCAVKINCGTYEMNVGNENEIFSTIELTEGSYYEMLNYKACHSVNPKTDYVLSIMLMGNLYENKLPFPKPNEKQEELTELEQVTLFTELSVRL